MNTNIKEFYLDLNPFQLLENSHRTFPETLILILYLILLSVFIYRILIFIIEKAKPPADLTHEYNRRKIIRTSYIAFCIFVYLPIFFSSLESLPTLIGFAGAGFVISLKEYWLSMIGWIFILGKDGFKVGDRIEIQGIKGDVVDIGFLRFTLLEVALDSRVEQSTNRLIHFPNYLVVNEKFFLVTEAMDFVWDEFRLQLEYGSNWRKAEEICDEVLTKELVQNPEEVEEKIKEVSKNYLVRMGATTPIVYTTIEEGYIQLSLRYLTPIRSKRTNRTLLSREILRRFENEDSLRFKK